MPRRRGNDTMESASRPHANATSCGSSGAIGLPAAVGIDVWAAESSRGHYVTRFSRSRHASFSGFPGLRLPKKSAMLDPFLS